MRNHAPGIETVATQVPSAALVVHVAVGEAARTAERRADGITLTRTTVGCTCTFDELARTCTATRTKGAESQTSVEGRIALRVTGVASSGWKDSVLSNVPVLTVINPGLKGKP